MNGGLFVFDPFLMIQLRILFYFAGTIIGWFAFYFLIDSLKRIEAFTKKKTDWRLIYLSLPLFLISPIAEVQSYYFLGKTLTGTEDVLASAFFVLSSAFLLGAVYGFKKHLNVKMMMPYIMAIAFLTSIVYSIIFLLMVSDSIVFALMLFHSMAILFLAFSFWIIGSYTREFHTVYPMPVFFISSSLLLLSGQILKNYAFAHHYFNLDFFTTLSLASTIFIFLGLMVAGISSFVFKRSVLEFKLKIGTRHVKHHIIEGES